jgi:uncharacterized repeat protein (TIGR01451 family)
VDRAGNLLIAANGSGTVVMERAPTAWQEVAGRRSPVRVRYALAGDGSIRFALPAGYDETRPLILDPTLTYSTYMGGGGEDVGYSVAVDAAGAAYVTGYTLSIDFPTKNALDPGCGTDGSCNGFAFTDAFVAKLTPSTSGAASLVFSAYLGGSGIDQGFGIAVDAANNVYVTGRTTSTDFPTASVPYQSSYAGGYDAFVAKLTASGAALTYSTYLGGSAYDDGYGIALGSSNRVYLVGTTFSFDFPTTGGSLQPSFGGFDDAYLAKVDPAGAGAASLIYSTYLGGNDDDQGYGLAVDGSDVAYVTGFAFSTNLPTAGGPFQPLNGGLWDAFVMKVDPAMAGAAGLRYSTYLGGLGTDAGFGLALDSSRNIYVTGQTLSATSFPTVRPFQAAHGGNSDAFLARIDNATTAADLSVGQSDSPDPVAAGSNLTYTLTVMNAGPGPAAGVRLTDVVLGRAALVSATPTQGSCTAVTLFAETDVSCDLGSLASGSAATVSIVVVPAAGGTITSTARVSSSVSDPAAANNTATESTTVTPTADLSIAKTDGSTTATPGQTITYTITVSNAGPDDAFGATVSDTVPAAIIGASWTCVGAGGGACTAGGPGNISDTVDLPVGASVTYTLTGTISPSATGSLANTAAVAVPGRFVDPAPADNSATDTDTLITCGSAIVVVPDGRLTASSVPASGNAWFGASLRIGNSYSVEFKNTTGASTPPGALTVFSGDDGCGTATLTTRETAGIDPAGSLGAVRVSFTAVGTASYFRARLANGSGSTVPISFSWSDTTMFSPAWSDFGAYDTFYSLQNTTGAALNGTLTLRNPAGSVVRTLNVVIPAGRAASTSTAALGIARNQTGTARFTHDGPPGAIVAEAAIASFSISPAYVQPVKFQAVREAK